MFGEATFFYHGSARWSLIFDSPNDAGAALGSLIPIIAAALYAGGEPARAGRPGYFVGYLLYSFAWFCLAKTYSRGGAVGAGCGILIISFFCYRNAPKRLRPRVWVAVILQCSLAIVITLSVGLLYRFKDIGAGDPAVWNRLDLWRGGLELVAGSPFNGWGRGMSGLSYMQWVQKPAIETIHGGMVNSYIHVGVEYGVPALALMIYVAVFPGLLAMQTAVQSSIAGSTVSLGLIGGVFGFLAASVFSTLWHKPVVFLPLAMMLLLAIAARRADGQAFRKTCLFAGCFAMVCASAVYLAGIWLRNSSRWTVAKRPSGEIVLTDRSFARTPAQIAFLVDSRVLGRLYGKLTRAALLSNELVHRVTVITPFCRIPRKLDVPTVVLGSRIAEIADCELRGPVVLIAPIVSPNCAFRGDQGGRIDLKLVVLPELDEFQVHPLWIAFCKARRIPVSVFPGHGQDMADCWAELLTSLWPVVGYSRQSL